MSISAVHSQQCVLLFNTRTNDSNELQHISTRVLVHHEHESVLHLGSHPQIHELSYYLCPTFPGFLRLRSRSRHKSAVESNFCLTSSFDYSRFRIFPRENCVFNSMWTNIKIIIELYCWWRRIAFTWMAAACSTCQRVKLSPLTPAARSLITQRRSRSIGPTANKSMLVTWSRLYRLMTTIFVVYRCHWLHSI